MNRRHLLRLAATLPLLSGGLGGLLDAANVENGPPVRTRQRVRPFEAAWPDEASWTRLREAVGGHLLRPQPLFGSCAGEPGGSACLEAHQNIGNPFWIGDQPGGTQVSGWVDAWTPAPSAYAIEAQATAHVAAGVNFARQNNLRLVVKGAGHSYLGTSTAADSLLIWTRAMNRVASHDAFVGTACRGRMKPVPAVSAEAGAVWMDLYDKVTVRGGRYVQGGGCTDVGVAGLVQSGGFGSFSKGYGTVAAGLLEAEIVTADGRVRIVNACSHPDLFWALKGGGGGTFGVVTRVTLRTHDLPTHFGASSGTIKARSDTAFARLIAAFLDFYRERLLNPHWGEQICIRPDNTLEISMVAQGLTDAQVRGVWEPFFARVNGAPQDFDVQVPLRAGARDSRGWWDATANPSMTLDRREGAPKNRGWWRGDQNQIGVLLHGYESLWMPAALLAAHERPRLADALLSASRHARVWLHFNKGLAGAPAEARAAVRQTATNPAVTEAFALAIVANGEAPAYAGLSRPAVDLAAARQDARAIDLCAAELRKVAPDPGSYVSESNFFNGRWQSAYWGTNYPRLLEIKAKYDPDGLFFVHHGVGSEQWSPDGFSRIG